MRADAGLAVARPSGDEDRAVGGRGGRLLMVAGAAVAAAAAAAYLTAIAAHPLATLLKGFDLQVYLGGRSRRYTTPAVFTPGPMTDTPGSSSPTRRSPRCCSRPGSRFPSPG
jgi:hypothetical protein